LGWSGLNSGWSGGVSQAADAIVVGFAKSARLAEQSLAPLRRLRQEGVLRSIRYVTWDSAEIDAYVAPILQMPDIELIRVRQPDAAGSSVQKNFVYQIRNLDAALSLIADDDALVLKWRPDYVANIDFLREKIACFELDSKIDGNPAPIGVTMPPPVFSSKIWIPWADSNQPFFYEDAVFLGRKRDLLKLVTPIEPRDIEMLADPDCNHYCHIIRFARIFLPSYPIFERYLRNYRYITNDMDYRTKLMPHLLGDSFFLFLLIAHAWVLYSEFHVDCGEQGDLLFYPNQSNKTTDWSRPETWRVAFPYDKVASWRKSTLAGHIMLNVGRPFGRLVDDDWQKTLFTKDNADFPRATLGQILSHVSQYRTGRLNKLEHAFCQDVKNFYRTHMKARSNAEASIGAAATLPDAAFAGRAAGAP